VILCSYQPRSDLEEEQKTDAISSLKKEKKEEEKRCGFRSNFVVMRD